jgi:hypothetical protein
MKKLLFIILLIPGVAQAQSFSGDLGTTETRCFRVTSGSTAKYEVSYFGQFRGGFSLALFDCRTGRYFGAKAYVTATPGQTKKGSFGIRQNGNVYLKAVTGGEWSLSIKKPRR